MIDVVKLRQDFPMLQNQPNLVYFDNGATTLKPQCVIDAIVDFYTRHTSNVHRGDYAIAAENDRLYDSTRQKVAKLITCDPKEVVFTHNATASMNQVAFGNKHLLKKGDVVLTSLAEHASNLLPWFQLQKEIGIEIEYVPLDEEGNLTVDNFRKAMHDGVKIVTLAQVTNVLGSIQPIKEITEIAHEYNAMMVVDGAQAVAHMPVDVNDLDVDFYIFSAHKMFGPSGVGVLYGKYTLLNEMEPILFGGDMNARFDKACSVELKRPPLKFEAGTPNIEGIIGLGAACDYLLSIGLEEIHTYEKELRQYFYEKMSQLDNVEIYNPNNVFGPIDFNVKEIFSQDTAGYLANKDIAVRSGNHCAKILHNVIGTDSTVRASLAFYNTKEEVDCFVEACKEVNLENVVSIMF